MLRPGLLGRDKWTFGRDYCGSVRMATGYCVPVGAGLRDHELNLLLRRSVMVRRRKAEVLAQLPPKRRRWKSGVIALQGAVPAAVGTKGMSSEI